MRAEAPNRFVLARDDGPVHALHGFTARDLDRVGCATCRERSARLLADRAGAAPSSPPVVLAPARPSGLAAGGGPGTLPRAVKAPGRGRPEADVAHDLVGVWRREPLTTFWISATVR